MSRYLRPCRIDVIARTESYDIRLRFGSQGYVIINWENNPNELRYHDPATGRISAVGGKGLVMPDRWTHIVWDIEPTRSVVTIDGEVRATFAGNYVGLSEQAGVCGWRAKLQIRQLDFTGSTANTGTTPPMTNVTRPSVVTTPAPARGPAPADAVRVPGPTTRIARAQSTIKALYVREEDSGDMLGLASELILTATPCTPRGQTPVTYVTAVGDQMTLVLDDVLRAVRVKYPNWAALKVELSFENRYSPKDGGSIGAAIGTLLYSMIHGFEIDPKLAITGDVTADSKIRKIGGVAAKIRGASAANCNVMLLPVDNYDQVVDAMVYEGPGLVTDIQIIGVGTLDEAEAMARVDRDPKVAVALDAFGSIQPLLKKSPERVHTKDIQDKLKHVLEAIPNHYSAKLLLAVAQNQQAKKLSVTASMYYALVAVRTALPTLYDDSDAAKQGVKPTVVQEGLRNLRKNRSHTDPKVLPFVDAMIDYIDTLNQVNSGRRLPAALEPKKKRVLETLTKLQADRALMEKTLHEGI